MIKIKGKDWEVLELLNQEVKPDKEIMKKLKIKSRGEFSNLMKNLRNAWLIETEQIKGIKYSKLTKMGKYYNDFYKRVKKWDKVSA